MARVMLALKTVLAAEDEIPVLIFDEVDANVGGETANAVGEKMKQIAAQASGVLHHAFAAGRGGGGRALRRDQANQEWPDDFRNHLLDKNARVTEMARMLGGQTAAARKHAEALLS